MKVLQQVLLNFALFVSWVLGQNQPPNCYLTSKPPAKPFPSLIQCFRKNAMACCNSAADSKIGTTYGEFLSASCLRRYPDLENYFCIACDSDQPTFMDTEKKVIRVCSTFARSIWVGGSNSTLNTSTQLYDNCGMNSYWKGKDGSDVILPSKEWGSIEEFFRDVKPPFFEDYTIQVVADNSQPPCYGYGAVSYTHLTLPTIYSV
eukprot:TRINITY_DN2389_c0_g1_i3.p1 TRINITY_DN2389_c0_g1~~TRINITY_DN2389_c0_g1_i3.p1  ORF type:complete len:204 (-),score=29.62 TRINITY_DN2389_c0_g1_i3:37-648(-)